MKIVVLFLIFYSLFLTNVFAAKILIVQSYHSGFAWDREYTKAIKKHLASDHELTFFQMDTKRIPMKSHHNRIKIAWAAYKKIKPDYVILGDDNALKYLGPKLEHENVKVIFLGINTNPRLYFESNRIPDNFTGVLERPLLVRNIFEIKKIVPKLNKILVLFDNGTTAQASYQEMRNIKKVGATTIDIKLIGHKKTWQEAIITAKQKGYDAIYIGLYHTIVDQQNVHVPAEDIMKWTSLNSELPIFCFWKYAVGKDKTIGGLLLDPYQQGVAASDLTKHLIENKTVPKVLTGKKGRFVFSRTELARWKLSLPDDIKEQTFMVD